VVGTAAKVAVASLGCDKNLVDSEAALGLLREAGYEVTPDPREADVILVNTCTFIGRASAESVEAVIDLARFKESGRARALVVMGCLAQRYGERLLEEIPEIDALVGTFRVGAIADAVEAALEGRRTVDIDSWGPPYPEGTRRVLTTPRATAYLKIADGCSNRCSYCVVPSVRGTYRSREMGALLEEARRLASGGVRELVLVAQETTLYGADLYGRPRLPELLERLCGVTGLEWVRVLYAHPLRVGPELVDLIAGADRVCSYLDMPVQHVSERVLGRMNRGGTRDAIFGAVRLVRERARETWLRTTLMVGFPGEKRSDVDELADFLRWARFEHAGVFTYSREEGTPAAALGDQLPFRAKVARRQRLMRIQRRISAERNSRLIGSRLRVLVERMQRGDGGAHGCGRVAICRHEGQAPGVDGKVIVALGGGSAGPSPGEMVDVEVTGSGPYDLYAKG